ncbi:Scr1 family TA system antitoxin-like transcriptional regulator [Micromonospora sagamiensis]|uniref:Scr1 family TA system antitoxin-like transcriptional regulator n=1 Tax=Micromonospora sagamiensis TaxID=47875 RepID=UPI00185F2E39|nr:hypothetical protein GCM10017556_20140 [Micromonospora sagamiensis]
MADLVRPQSGPRQVDAGPAFITADLAEGSRVAYLDNQLSGQIVDQPEEVARLGVAWDALRGEALPGRQSLNLLKEVAQTWT